MAKGQHLWRRQKKVYVSKWKDRRDVLCLTTAHHLELTTSENRFKQVKIKPLEVVEQVHVGY